MRRLLAIAILSLLSVGATLAQPAAPAPAPRLLCVARVMDAWFDIEALGRLTSLDLTDVQLQALAAIYQQHPVPGPDLELAREAADKVEAVRKQILAGGMAALKPADQEALGKLLQTVFSEFNEAGRVQTDTVTALTDQEKLVWAVLTPAQQNRLLDVSDRSAVGRRALEVLARLRATDEAEWPAMRDRLASALAAAAGADGTPARENSRQMLLDFLNRVRAMSAADFSAKQTELGAEVGALIPAGVNLAAVLAECDPATVHHLLRTSLLNPRAPALLQEMQAARTAAH